jgi:hypothetical protein
MWPVLGDRKIRGPAGSSDLFSMRLSGLPEAGSRLDAACEFEDLAICAALRSLAQCVYHASACAAHRSN